MEWNLVQLSNNVFYLFKLDFIDFEAEAWVNMLFIWLVVFFTLFISSFMGPAHSLVRLSTPRPNRRL